MHRRHLLAAGLATALPLPSLAQAPAPAPAPAERRHALSLLAPPALPADFAAFPWVNPEAPKGGAIALTALGSYDSFNQFILRGTAAVGLGLLYDSLMAPNPDEASVEYAHLAEYLDLAADGLSVAFTLREGAKWHDGKPITADDVAWTFGMLREHGRPGFRAYYADVAECVAETPRRVRFSFKNGDNRELALIIGQISPLPRHWWEGRDFARPLLEVPLGSGPYRIESFEAGRGVTYARVPDAWGRDLPTQRGQNNFDTIRYDYYRDSTVALEAFKAGQVDFRTENIARDWATAYDFPARRAGLVKLDEIRHELPTGMQAFAMNLRRPMFQDRRVREALGLVFDFEWMNANLFYGAYARTESYFSNSDFSSRGLPQGEELALLEPYRAQLPPEVFTQEFHLPTTDGRGSNRDGTRAALRLLREAGWTIRERRLVGPNGQPFEFEILLNGPSFERVALPYVQALARIGVEARVRTVDPAQYQVRTDAFDYDMTVDVIPQSNSPGNEQRDYFTCATAAQRGSQNVVGICDPVVDALVDKVIAAPDLPSLTSSVRALDRVLLWNYFVIPNWHSRTFRIAYWDRFGRPEKNPRYGLGFPASWWMDAAKDAATAEARRSL